MRLKAPAEIYTMHSFCKICKICKILNFPNSQSKRDASQAFAFVGAAIVLSSLFIGIETELAVPGEPRRTRFILLRS